MDRTSLLVGTYPPLPRSLSGPVGEQAIAIAIYETVMADIDREEAEIVKKQERAQKRRDRMTEKTWANAVGRSLKLGGAVEFTRTNVHQTLHIPCCHGHVAFFTIPPRFPPDKIVRYMIEHGWTVGGNKITCPDHQPKRRSREKVPRRAPPPPPPPRQDPPVQEKEVEMSNVTPMAVPTPTSTEAARLAKRAAMDWLTEAFDVEKGRYREGVDDSSIAKETKLSETAVRVLREEFFGPLKEPGEVGQMRDTLATLREETTAGYAATMTKIDQTIARLDRLCSKHGW